MEITSNCSGIQQIEERESMKRRLFFVGLVVVLLSAFALTGTSLAAGTPSNPVLTVLYMHVAR